MSMHINIFVLLILFSQMIYSKVCPDKEYIKYKSLSFVRKGFKSAYAFNPKTKEAECELGIDTYIYNKYNKKKNSKPIKIIGIVTGIREIGGKFLIIHAFAGAHNGVVYFFNKKTFVRDEGIIYILEPIKIDKKNNYFFSNMGESIFVNTKLGAKNMMIEVLVYNMDNNKSIKLQKYKMYNSNGNISFQKQENKERKQIFINQ